MTAIAYDLTRLSAKEKAGLERFLNTIIDPCMHKTLVKYGDNCYKTYPVTIVNLMFDRAGDVKELLEKCLELGEIK